MIVDIITRGNLVAFSASFLDINREVVTPSSANLRVDYLADGVRITTDAITMTMNTGGTWSGDWDSSVASGGRVYWAIKAVGPEAASEGYFDLSANRANVSD